MIMTRKNSSKASSAKPSSSKADTHRVPMREFSRSLPMLLLRGREAVMRYFRPSLLEHDITELAVAAGLFLVPAALGDGFADRLLIADRRRMGFDVDAETIAQPLLRHPQMHFTLPP